MRRFSSIAAGILLLPGGLAGQRLAALPPACALPGSNVAPRVTRHSTNALAVLPLAIGRGGEEVSYLSDGLADAIAYRVATTLPSVEVILRRVQRRAATNDVASLRGIGAELETRYLISGAIAGSREGTRVTVSLFDGAAGKRTWERTFMFDSVGGTVVVQTVAKEVISRVVGGTLSPQQTEALASVPTRNKLAFESSLRGDAAMDGGAYDRAAVAFQRAVQLDPAFVYAHAKLALADAALLDDGVEKSSNGTVLIKELQSAATKAVSVDPKSALAWLAEARSRLLQGSPTSSWRAAFQRALSLDARNPDVLEQYGLALAQTDDHSAARDMLRRAAALAPRRAEISTALAELAVADKNDGEACGLLNQAIAEDALHGPAWALRALLRARHDELRFAWADAETASQIGSVLLGESATAIIDMKARDTTLARAKLEELWLDVVARGTISVREGRAVATAFIGAGEMSKALDVLEAVRPRGPLYAAMLRDPAFDSARREPRFRALMGPRQSGPPNARVSADTVFVSSRPTGDRTHAPVPR